MMDIDSQMSACRATWIHKIINNPGDWAFLGKHYIEQFGQNQLILKTNFCNSKYLPDIKSIPLFYQSIILSYNRSKQSTTICDEQSLLDQVLWGNMHFLHETSVPNQKQTLFFKRWIESGLIYLREFKFTNGTLDENFLFCKVKNKKNIYCEILCVKKALKPFEDIIRKIKNNATDENLFSGLDSGLEVLNMQIDSARKSRPIYEKIKKQKIVRPYQEEIWETVFNQHDIDFQKVYLCKIKYIPDRKLSEFNFKVLHLILPCGLNLRRWGQKNYDICEICGVTHDIVHMLFYCEKARQIWNLIGQIFNVQMSLKHVVLTDSDNDMSFLFSLVSFLIYKEWLLFSVNETWRTHNIIAFLIWELKLKLKIYRKIGDNWQNICHYIEQITSKIDAS